MGSICGRSLTAALTLAAAAVMSGCVIAPVGPGDGAVYVAVPPPAPRYEVIGPPPFLGALWIGGFWHWGGGRHQWVPGRWEQPRPGYAWRQPAWQHEAPGWRESPGGWYRDRGGPEQERGWGRPGR